MLLTTLFQFCLTLDNAPGDVLWFLKVLKSKSQILLHFVYLLAAVLPEGIIHDSPDFTTIILILLAVIILVVLIVLFFIFARRRRNNKTKGIFCYLLYCIIFGFQNSDLIAEPNDVFENMGKNNKTSINGFSFLKKL